MTALSWVIGAGGLLGSSVARHLDGVGPRWVPPTAIDWDHHDAALDQLRGFTRGFLAEAGPGPWKIAWCAGAGVTGSAAAQLEHEPELFTALLEELRRAGSPGQLECGTVFLASSAGALYAGSTDPPFTEATPVAPISVYGLTKVSMEDLARTWATETGGAVLLGRIANLYGPAQNLGKPQGLISQIIKSHLLRAPISIYVPLDTMRDYIYADDCGALVADALGEFGRGASDGPKIMTKIFASHRAVTVSAIIGEMRRIFKRTPQIILGSSPEAALQARDLRLRSQIHPVVPRRLTSLSAGIHATTAHLRSLLGQGKL